MTQLTWNFAKDQYEAQLPAGLLTIDASEMAEVARGVDVAELSRKANLGGALSDTERELLDADVWAICLGANQNVSIE